MQTQCLCGAFININYLLPNRLQVGCPEGDRAKIYTMNITLKDLLDSGVHFGHQVRRYNPKAKKFVYDNRHGISIIDLEKTYEQLEQACAYLEELVASGKEVLFVGTKRQAQDIIREVASGCSMPFAASRWLGGCLTNYTTVKGSLEKYKRYLAMESDGSMDKLHNKEAAAIRRQMSRMNRNFEGLLEMKGRPAALFVIDAKNEAIAIAEANRLKIPVIGLVDTNSDPSTLDIPIPGNDDSIKSIRIILETVMDAVQAGLARREAANAAPVIKKVHVQADTAAEEQVAPVPVAEDAEVPESFSTDSSEA